MEEVIACTDCFENLKLRKKGKVALSISPHGLFCAFDWAITMVLVNYLNDIF